MLRQAAGGIARFYDRALLGAFNAQLASGTCAPYLPAGPTATKAAPAASAVASWARALASGSSHGSSSGCDGSSGHGSPLSSGGNAPSSGGSGSAPTHSDAATSTSQPARQGASQSAASGCVQQELQLKEQQQNEQQQRRQHAIQPPPPHQSQVAAGAAVAHAHQAGTKEPPPHMQQAQRPLQQAAQKPAWQRSDAQERAPSSSSSSSSRSAGGGSGGGGSGNNSGSRYRAAASSGGRDWSTGGAGAATGGAAGQSFQIVQYVRGGTELVMRVTGRTVSDAELYAQRRTVRPVAGDAAGAKRAAKLGAGKAAPLPPARAPDTGLRALVSGSVRKAKKQLQATFLPAGYPSSVGSNYLQYSGWQAITNVATTASGVMASTFLLYSVGLGAGAIPTAGALNWVLKDGLGQMGTLLFGKAIAHNFDIHSKSWFFLSYLLLCTATGLEIMTFVLPDLFLLLGSCANMIKGLSWMAGGSTRSVFNLSFVRDNNIADITAKNTSQYIFASLFGTAAGVSLCAYIGQSAPAALGAFSALTFAGLYGAYRTVKSIPLPTLNSTRLQLLTTRYLKCVGRDSEMLRHGLGYVNYQQEYEVHEDDVTCELELPSPLDLAALDPPLPWFMGDQRILNPDIRVGTPMDQFINGDPEHMLVLINTFRYSRYMLSPTADGFTIHMILHHDAAPRDIAQAYLQACILRRRLKRGLQATPDNLAELRIVLHDSLLAAESLASPFLRALARQGWLTDKIVVEAHRRRARW